MTEDQLEQGTLSWLAELGYAMHSGYDIAHDGTNLQRASLHNTLLLRLIVGQNKKIESSIPWQS